eukprot:TRINITY_DN1066_c0_g1_i1.p1 TRINITY_DN1066_c0_g1~~TRINITY_DN1066_c0_g1_i1.p1  ORF type:complete len:790 (+),score=239.65 TRINITY_DN1066_c0_g1_i1:29-2398(+)
MQPDADFDEDYEPGSDHDSSDDEDFAESQAKVVVSKSGKPLCQYGVNCYRKNPAHFAQFAHPHLDDKKSTAPQQATAAIAATSVKAKNITENKKEEPKQPMSTTTTTTTTETAKFNTSKPSSIPAPAPAPAPAAAPSPSSSNVPPSVDPLLAATVMFSNSDEYVNTPKKPKIENTPQNLSATIIFPEDGHPNTNDAQKIVSKEPPKEEDPSEILHKSLLTRYFDNEAAAAISWDEAVVPSLPDLDATMSDISLALPIESIKKNNSEEITVSHAPSSSSLSESSPFLTFPAAPHPGHTPTTTLPPSYQDSWKPNRVKLPCSPKSTYRRAFPFPDRDLSRWYLIQSVLSAPIISTQNFEDAVLAYTPHPEELKFYALHHYFNNVATKEQSESFFMKTLPNIVRLAMRLPELCPSPIDLLPRKKNGFVKLKRIQIACLLANCFLCTFPKQGWHKSDAIDDADIPHEDVHNLKKSIYPGFSFGGLFAGSKSGGQLGETNPSVSAKLQCFLHYFESISLPSFNGLEDVIFERHYMPINQLPHWRDSTNSVAGCSVTIKENGLMEDAPGHSQVDFANKSIGGGVLGRGAIQEEVLFSIYPECVASLLFSAVLGKHEVIIIKGVKRFSSHTGYADSFRFSGEYNDTSSGSEILCMDALQFSPIPKQRIIQYDINYILREINKAYIAFSHAAPGAPIATGNWGCGAFGGFQDLKAVVQILAAAQSGHNLSYFTFGVPGLGPCIDELCCGLRSGNATVGQCWAVLEELSALAFNEGGGTGYAAGSQPQIFNALLDKFA